VFNRETGKGPGMRRKEHCFLLENEKFSLKRVKTGIEFTGPFKRYSGLILLIYITG
jgi:hypothetical protein